MENFNKILIMILVLQSVFHSIVYTDGSFDTKELMEAIIYPAVNKNDPDISRHIQFNLMAYKGQFNLLQYNILYDTISYLISRQV